MKKEGTPIYGSPGSRLARAAASLHRYAHFIFKSMQGVSIDRIKEELLGDKRVYLHNCKSNYLEYVNAAQILFPEYYRSINDYFKLYKFNELSLKYKELGDLIREQEVLKQAVDLGIDTPYTYDRLSLLYSKTNMDELALQVCEKWFNAFYWKIPNMATGSLRILDRLERLKVKKGRD